MDAIRNDETKLEMYSVKVKKKENTAGLLEHSQRVDESRIRDQVLHYTLRGKRDTGRPRNRWEVEAEIRTFTTI
jgi:hypothetical protein